MADPFKIRRRILFGDCDPGGVVYTPRFADFAVEATLDFLAFRLGGPAARRIFEMGVLPPARAFSLEFLKPLTWDDEIAITVSVAEIRIHSFTLAVEATNASGESAFRARLTQVCVSPETRSPVEIPEALRRALSD